MQHLETSLNTLFAFLSVLVNFCRVYQHCSVKSMDILCVCFLHVCVITVAVIYNDSLLTNLPFSEHIFTWCTAYLWLLADPAILNSGTAYSSML